MPAIHQVSSNGFSTESTLGSLLNKVSLSGSSSNGNSSSTSQWDTYRSSKTGDSLDPSSSSNNNSNNNNSNSNSQQQQQYERSNTTASSSSAYAASSHSHAPSHKSSTFSLSSQATFPPPTSTSSTTPLLSSPNLPPGTRDFPPPLQPRSYTILKEVGDGSFGTVWLADWHSSLVLPPGTLPPGPSSRPEYKGKKLVAIKRMKKAFEGGWEECMKLKELKVS